MNITNPLSALSYTNKDFRDVYVELLDLVKKLTYKWDPSISNESDPGVILLKLNAIIADKNNYNIDKNILETFPETVTQEVNARNLYKQVGYRMPWYESATMEVLFKWVKKDRDIGIGETVTIPKYTMLTDSETKILYTLLQDVTFNYNNNVSTGKVIQGTITDVIVNGNKNLSVINLDHNNRIYLNDTNVAENGVFISNIGESNAPLWERVDNLQIEPYNSRVYEFGVDSRNNSVYIEFPDDVDKLIGEGINIKYVVSDGVEGNVAAKTIVKFYDDVTVTVGNEDINLNEESVQLYNSSASISGRNPENALEAYKSYKKVAGTFDTLVTLRDYINAIYNSKLVSNVIVSDRLTDIQSSYYVIEDTLSYNVLDKELVFERDNNSVPKLNSYNLKLYLLHIPINHSVNTIDEYESTFELETPDSPIQKQVKSYIQNSKCVQHDFVDIEQRTPCLFQNVYPLRIKIVPHYHLNEAQIEEVKVNIIKALFKTLNSREVEFGEEPNYDVIYDTILTSDERIKVVVLDDFDYTTFVTYLDGNEFKSIPINNFESYPYAIKLESTTNQTQLSDITKDLKNKDRYYFYDSNYNIYKTDKNGNLNTSSVYSNKVQEFRKQIIAKNVLAGVTPLYNQDTSFKYSIAQQEQAHEKDIDRVTTDLVISPFGGIENNNGNLSGSTIPTTPNKRVTSAEYTLKDNEFLQFLAPSFKTDSNYSTYVKYELVLKDTNKSDYAYVRSVDVTFETDIHKVPITFTDGEFTCFVCKYKNKTMKYNTKDGNGVVELRAFYQDSYCPVRFVKEQDINNMTYSTVIYVYYKNNWVQWVNISDWKNGIETLYVETPVLTIPSDSDYQLKDGESITFFWREVDEKDAPYAFKKYEGTNNKETSPIIKPTFTMYGVLESDRKIKVSTTSGQLKYGTNEFNIISQMPPENDLTSTKQIDIRKMNQVNLMPNNNYYYFITNNIVSDRGNDTYRMVLKKVTNNTGSNSTNDYEYILKEDEYFIYTNSKFTEYEVLSNGTLLRITKNSTANTIELKTDVIPEDEIMTTISQGITDNFKNIVHILDYKLLIREQQIYNLSSGDTIAITLQDEYLNNNSKYPIFQTGKMTSCKGMTISYATNKVDTEDTGSSKTLISLPDLEINDAESCWKGTAYLNITSSPDKPQVIDNTDSTHSSQKITINGVTYPKSTSTSNLLYLLSTISLSSVGGTNVDVSYIDEYGQRKSVELLLYSIQTAFTKEPFFDYDSASGLKMKFNNKADIDIELDSNYSYILGITNTCPIDAGTFSLKSVDKDVKCLNDPSTTNHSTGTYYFQITGNTKKLTFQTTGGTKDDYILIHPLFKYKENTVFDKYGLKIADIEETVKKYDINRKFKYNYQVNRENYIEDPLLGKEFFNDIHVFNRYTISNAMVRMSNNSYLDSNISIISNR